MDSLKIIARYRDGRMLKGTTSNFDPKRRRFHLTPLEAAPGQLPVPIALKNLKAVFVVRDFTGDPLREESRQFNSEASAYGKKLQVTFEDGVFSCSRPTPAGTTSACSWSTRPWPTSGSCSRSGACGGGLRRRGGLLLAAAEEVHHRTELPPRPRRDPLHVLEIDPEAMLRPPADLLCDRPLLGGPEAGGLDQQHLDVIGGVLDELRLHDPTQVPGAVLVQQPDPPAVGRPHGVLVPPADAPEPRPAQPAGTGARLLLPHRQVADPVAHQGHGLVGQARQEQLALGPRGRRLEVRVHHLDDAVLGVDVHAAGGAFGHQVLGLVAAVLVGHRGAEGLRASRGRARRRW